MREFRVTVKDEVQNNSLLCRVVPSVIDIGGIAREHNATRITFVLPESWNTDEGSFFVECESNNGEAALSVPLLVATENGAKVIYFDIPYGMTAAGTSELTLKQETFDEDGKTLIKCVRSAKLRVRFPDSTTVDGENRKLAEDLLGGMSAEIKGLVTRFNNGEFNGKDGKDGADGAKGEKGDKGDKGEDGTGGIPIVTELPETAVNGDLCIYSVPNILKTLDGEGRIVISIAELQELSTTGENAYFALILRKNGVEVINLFVYSYDNQISNFQYIDVAEGTDYYLSFDNGVYDPLMSHINNEVVDLSAFPETYYLPEYDSITCDFSGGLPERYRYVAQLMEYDNGWQAVKSLLELSNKAHTHSNKKTLDEFYCESLETGFATDASSTELKWRGKPIAFDFAGSKVSMVQEVEKNGKRYYRLWFTHGSFMITNVPDYIDIPIDTLNKVTESGDNITLNGAELDFGVGKAGSGGVQSLTAFPEVAKEGDVVLLHRCNEISADDSNSGVVLDTAAIATLKLPEGITDRYWEFDAPNPTGHGFNLVLEQTVIAGDEPYVLTGITLFTETFGGRWYWRDGKPYYDIPNATDEPLPDFIPLGVVESFTATKDPLYGDNILDIEDTDNTTIFRTAPREYMYTGGEWKLTERTDEAEGSIISEVKTVVKDGQNFLELRLADSRNFKTGKKKDFIYIPVAGVKDVTQQSGGITLNGSELEFKEPDTSRIENRIKLLETDMESVGLDMRDLSSDLQSLKTADTEIWQAINNINGGIDEIETLIDESGVLE